MFIVEEGVGEWKRTLKLLNISKGLRVHDLGL